MPLLSINHNDTQALALWKIEEPENYFLDSLQIAEQVPTDISHTAKRLEYLAGRFLTQQLLRVFGYRYEGIAKDEFGKPFLKNCSLNISLSHSYPFVAGIVHTSKSVGIDIEQKKQNLIRVAPRVFSDAELLDANNDLTKLCIYWCSKEALIKIYGKKDLHLRDELLVDSFVLGKEGKLIGRINRKEHENFYALQYIVENDYVLAYTL